MSLPRFCMDRGALLPGALLKAWRESDGKYLRVTDNIQGSSDLHGGWQQTGDSITCLLSSAILSGNDSGCHVARLEQDLTPAVRAAYLFSKVILAYLLGAVEAFVVYHGNRVPCLRRKFLLLFHLVLLFHNNRLLRKACLSLFCHRVRLAGKFCLALLALPDAQHDTPHAFFCAVRAWIQLLLLHLDRSIIILDRPSISRAESVHCFSSCIDCHGRITPKIITWGYPDLNSPTFSGMKRFPGSSGPKPERLARLPHSPMIIMMWNTVIIGILGEKPYNRFEKISLI